MRQGKNINLDDPTYMLDKNRGFFRVNKDIVIKSVKYINRDAYDANYFDMEVGGKRYRVQKDELMAGLQYV